METKNKDARHSIASASFPRRRESRRDSRKFAGFTLVELIVVITILVILGTIAFLNLGNFSGSARDSSRVSDLANVSQGLDLWYVKNGTVPNPDASMVTITASGVTIGYQWYAGSSVLTRIKMGNAQDPSDKKYYTYLVNADYTKYQLLALLEDSTTTTSFVPSTYADYSARYPTTKGSSLGVLLGNTGSTLNQPIQEFTGSLELITATGGLYQAYVSKTNIISATGSALGGLAGFYTIKSAGSTYPGCDTKDIALPNGQVWAACNVGATSAYAGQSIADCASSATDCDASLRYTLGSYFQWGRNEDVTNLSTSATLANAGTTANTIFNKFIVSAADWMSVQDGNLWGGTGTTSTAGTFLTQWSPSAMQWPCASWFHIPTRYEWWLAISQINPAIPFTPSTFQNDTSVAKILKLPLAGRRDSPNGLYMNQNVFGDYWTSSTDGATFWGRMRINSIQINTIAAYQQAGGFPIRCLKN